MKVMEQRLVHTPISRAREILQKYGVPHDVLMWEGAGSEAPGPKKVQQMLKQMQLEGLREKRPPESHPWSVCEVSNEYTHCNSR